MTNTNSVENWGNCFKDADIQKVKTLGRPYRKGDSRFGSSVRTRVPFRPGPNSEKNEPKLNVQKLIDTDCSSNWGFKGTASVWCHKIFLWVKNIINIALIKRIKNRQKIRVIYGLRAHDYSWLLTQIIGLCNCTWRVALLRCREMF